ncbi:hypothetical protein CJ030_MR1G017671 [Morella rubra]|uniref:U6 snRNA phosphodiesterase 1 n=1 Tax=Morella rubra TaxID=262757 RepID=A0A6A1WJV4_9ROSI|nr:hypothetical protein CJ030_MR1G017671 [Morella rubra]
MEALKASYGDISSDSDNDASTPVSTNSQDSTTPLPSPPVYLLNPSSSNPLGTWTAAKLVRPLELGPFPMKKGTMLCMCTSQMLIVYEKLLSAMVRKICKHKQSALCPVFYIPDAPKKELALCLKKLTSLVLGLHVADVDVPLDSLCKDDHKLEQVALGREFHISLGRTVPIRVHQIDSVVSMLRQKLQSQKRSDFISSISILVQVQSMML